MGHAERKDQHQATIYGASRVSFTVGSVNGSTCPKQCIADVRLLDAAGSVSNVGLLQVRMDADFGTVCGANAASADVMLATATTCMF